MDYTRHPTADYYQIMPAGDLQSEQYIYIYTLEAGRCWPRRLVCAGTEETANTLDIIYTRRYVFFAALVTVPFEWFLQQHMEHAEADR